MNGGVKGAIRPLTETGGARASLTVLGAGSRLGEHVHDHPYLSLHVLGGYRESGDAGDAAIDGPAAAFHPAGAAHEDAIGDAGLATVVVEFEAAWMLQALGPWARLDRTRYWIGGPCGATASRLARAWLSRAPADRLLAATERFLASAAEQAAEIPASTSRRLDTVVEVAGSIGTRGLAQQLGVSRPWIARDYRRRKGEGIGETLRRRRVEAAVRLIETSGLPLAEIALDVGFCDQSHMNRAFKALLGLTPAAVRADQLGLAYVSAP